jgi:uncharacterized protein YndB with AHSA1/START domain
MSERTPPEGVISAASDADGLEIVRILPFPREAVFRAWTEPDAFAAWFGEHGSSVPLDTVEMDVRPGGAWRATMLHGPEEVELPFSGEYREVEPPERLVFTVTDSTEIHGGGFELITAVFRDLGDGRTEMTVTQRGGNLSAEQYELTLRGWLIFLERQHDYLKARHDTL